MPESSRQRKPAYFWLITKYPENIVGVTYDKPGMK